MDSLMEIQIPIDTLYFYSLEYSQRDISSDHKKINIILPKTKTKRHIFRP